MACAVPTDPGVVTADGPAASPVAPFDLDAAWELHPQVSIRPERFGALLYHFGTRRLSFLKSPELLGVVNALVSSDTARDACLSVGVSEAQLASYGSALATLATSQMIRPRSLQ